MHNFVYDIPVRIYFGEGQLCHLGEELKKYGKRVLLTYGGGSIKKTGLYDQIKAEIDKAGLELFELSGIAPNPRIDSVREGAKICKEKKIDVLLAVGGGSVIDATKFMAAGACVDFDPWEFLSKNRPIEKALPILTVVTLAAAGSEMHGGAVISNPETNEKTGTRVPAMRPVVSFLDPTNTFTVSRMQTACSAADIMSHTMEVYFNMHPDLFLLDCFMEGIMKTVVKYAPIALEKPDDYEARANLMWASTWAINGMMSGGKRQRSSCHPIEHEISAFYDITHGLGIAIVTPRWMRYCLDETTVSRYVQYAVNVFGVDPGLPPMEAAEKGIEALEHFLFDTLGLTRTLTELGIGDEKFDVMAEKASKLTKNAFRDLSKEDIVNILKMCL